jgi:SEC-C motif-containing protein
MVQPRSRPCPCGSGKTYGACCAPYHEGKLSVPDAESLVRARYSAFALGEIEFLWQTLHEDHPDRAKHGREKVLAALRHASSSFKYMGLRILETRPEDDAGVARALYVARLFRKGQNVSFAELAEFMREAGAPRYRAGKVKDATTDAAIEGLTVDNFVGDPAS